MSWKNTIITKASHPKEWALIKLAFPGYRKRKANITETENVALTGRFWDGGSINHYIVIPVCDRVIPYSPTVMNKDAEMDLTDGTQVVQCGVFCGSPGTATLYRKPDETSEPT